MPRLSRVLGLGRRVILAIVVRVRCTVARSRHRTREGGGPGRLRGGRMVILVFMVTVWVRGMCFLVGQMRRMLLLMSATGLPQCSGAGRESLYLGARKNA